MDKINFKFKKGETVVLKELGSTYSTYDDMLEYLIRNENEDYKNILRDLWENGVYTEYGLIQEKQIGVIINQDYHLDYSDCDEFRDIICLVLFEDNLMLISQYGLETILI